MDDAPIISFRRVEKRFPGVRALEEVSFDIARGSCHALCGENGAGKSTLGKLLAGIDTPDGGEILLDGRPVRFDSPRDALAAGVGMVHQELAFCENMSVAENLCLGALPRRGPFVDRPAVERRGRQLLEAIEATIDVHRLVGELTVAEQQVVQIASAVGGGARVIIFDEPTSSLSEQEADHLYALMGRLRERGVTCVYVSHRMPEIFRLCDTITVLRDGRHVTTQPARALDEAALVELMIGRRLDLYLPKQTTPRAGRGDPAGRPAVEPGQVPRRQLRGPRRRDRRSGRAGGRRALRRGQGDLRTGCRRRGAGRGRRARLLPGGSPIAAMRAGLGLVPEDRKRQGFIPQLSGSQNLALPVLPQLARWGWLPAGAERALGEEAFQRLNMRAPNLDAATVGLSGGNQQKIVFAKWLAARCRLLILDEPTRGVDVGAKSEIHSLIHDLAEAGTGILLISSELPELIALSTRMLVLREGRLVGALPRGSEQGSLIRLMAGIDHAAVVSDA